MPLNSDGDDQRGGDSGTRSDRLGMGIMPLTVQTQSAQQLGRVLTPLDAQAGETTPNDLALQPVTRVTVGVDESQRDMRVWLGWKCGQKKPTRRTEI